LIGASRSRILWQTFHFRPEPHQHRSLGFIVS
jgi:hypothetical protein